MSNFKELSWRVRDVFFFMNKFPQTRNANNHRIYKILHIHDKDNVKKSGFNLVKNQNGLPLV